ncbi:MAG TPA: HAD family phosphatase [Fibrobacteraceae bacterium]|nr:HAD family phosphatase [Fibrobacteraceae bacterium]
MRKRAVIFDWGGVLCVDPVPGLLHYCALALDVRESELSSAVSQQMNAFTVGLPEEEFWRRVCKALHLPPPERSLWGEALAAVYEPRLDTLALCQELAALSVNLGLLTNTEPPSHLFHLTLGYDFFSARVFSCEDGLAKPDPAIYRLCTSRLGLEPSQCLMVDDRPVNVSGAMEAGLSAYLFRSVSELRDFLTEWLPSGILQPSCVAK